MTLGENSFRDFRLKAAKSFAQTMVVIDDEARQTAPQEQVSKLRPPTRGPARRARKTKPIKEQANESTHALNARELIERAMELGLVCSVLRPKKGESVRTRVRKVARCADIVCLDWEIYGDGGASATKIIKDIVLDDVRRNGRMRLIAIYTGDTTNNKILDKVFEEFSESFRAKESLKQDSLHIVSERGLKIVCLFKTHGIQLSDSRRSHQVAEKALPGRLQEEFATLAEGLLSTVALATIASIRSSTHHVLAKITGEMDGPYFHHRAILPYVGDAEEYAVAIILSELKSAVDKHEVGEAYAGPNAIRARIREMAKGAETFTLKYGEKSKPQLFEMRVEDGARLIIDGCTTAHLSMTNNKPPRKQFEREVSTLFSKDREAAHDAMLRFAVLTGISADPRSHIFDEQTKVPILGLGTVIRERRGAYLLCLQATCDAVRIKSKSAFLFVPLTEVSNEPPDHVVPIIRRGSAKSVGLAISAKSYTKAKSIEFASSPETGTVLGVRTRGRSFEFVDVDGVEYPWIANLKQRRALRTAQRLGDDMGRLGFDEFEPFRKRSE